MTDRKELFELVDEEFSPENAHKIAVEMTDHYRAPGTSGFHTAMDTVESHLREAGLNVSVERPVVENIWEPNAADLSIVDPERIHLTDFESAPSSIAWTSSPTDGPEQFEVVDVGTGEEPSDFENVEAKVVFIHGTTRRPGWWHAAKNAVEAGARGIITDYMLYQTPDVREPELVPEATQLLRLRPKEWFAEKDVWAFSIAHKSAEILTDKLADGPVTVEANVDAEMRDDEVPYIEALVEGNGQSDQTIVFCGHASGIKPGANCAEGTGLVVELARAVNSLTESGMVDQHRTITFILGAEGPVSEQFLSNHPDASENVLAALSYCSTGHEQNKTESCLMLSSSPDSVPHYINDYLDELSERTPKEADWIGKEGGRELPLLSFKQHYYTPWSDNTRFAPEGIPAPLFMSWPDRCFHSQLLTEDVMDPDALRRTALVSGVAALELAAAESAEAESIARLVAGRSLNRIHSAAAEIDHEAAKVRDRRHLEYLTNRDVQALRSVQELADSSLDTVVDRLEDSIRTIAEHERAALPSPKPDSRGGNADLVPVRTIDSPIVSRRAGLEYEDLLKIAEMLSDADEDAGWRSLRVVSDEAWNFIDGQRTVGEIADAVGFEFDMQIEPEPVYRILSGHAEVGNLRFEEA